MRFIHYLLLSFALSLAAHPSFASSNICEDLAANTCTDGSYNDGTGTTRRIDRSQISNDAILLKFRKDIRKHILKLMAKPEARGLKEFCRKNSVNHDSLVVAIESALRGGGAKSANELELNPYFKKIVASLRLEISKHLTDPKKKARLHKVVFPEIKRLLEQRLKLLPIEEMHKAAMISKIQSVTLDKETACDHGRPILFRTTSRYDSFKNSVRVCDGSLTEDYSEFKLAHSLGHELSHSIDPCSLGLSPPNFDRTAMEESYPIKGLISCLRSDTSIAAKSSPADPLIGAAEGAKIRPVYDFCENDQVIESFADWLSAEVLTAYLEKHFQLTKTQWQTGFSNVFRFNCDDPPSDDDSSYPSIEHRMNRLLLTQPAVRKKMGCEAPAKFQYCKVQP